ncbi:hypothetical protein EDD22DRAFT_582087 [Suillus occidentalis]|nr:hypothetical protein EDD22DRAFT_582087 [Suillus occidentalis]
MRFYSTSQSSSSPSDDELAESDKPYHRDYPNTMLSFNHPDLTFPSSYTSTSANTQATRLFSFPRMRTGTSSNVSATPNTSNFTDDTSSYYSNTATYPTYYDHYTESRSHTVPSLPAWAVPSSDSSTLANPPITRFPSGTSPNISTVPNTFSFAADTSSNSSDTSTYLAYYDDSMESNASPDRYFPHHREEVTSTHAKMDSIARPQDHYPTTDSMPYTSYAVVNPLYPVTYEPESSSCAPVRNTSSYHGAQYHNTVAQPQGGVHTWYPKNSVTGGNLPQSYQLVQDLSGYTPRPPQYALPRVPSVSSYCGSSSSSHREPSPSPYCDTSSSSQGGTSSYRREASFYYDSSANHPEAYHGSWPQCGDYDLPPAGSRLLERPGPSTAPSRLATRFSHPNIGHGNNTSNPSYHPPSIQPHQDLPCHNSRSRRDSRRRRESHASGTYHSSSTTFSCGWLVRQNTTCGFEGPLDAFKEHFRGSHLSGSQDAENVCCWRGCGYRKRNNTTIRGMRRDSVWRHVSETHLGRKRVIN